MTGRYPPNLLPLDRINELFIIEPAEGLVTWKFTVFNFYSGQRAGTVTPDGYRRVKVGPKYYRTSLIVWTVATGSPPVEQVDHRDGDRANDRFGNLRLATNSQNQANSKCRKNNKSGVKGVSFQAGRFVAEITKDGKKHYIGRFDTVAEAKAAYGRLAEQLFGEFSRVSERT
jgi:hypothetical protein